MKNINITAIPFTESIGELSSGNFLGMGGNVRVDQNNNSSIHLLVSITASENKSGKHENGETKFNTCFFSEPYDICIRLTETVTGQFLDLGVILFDPQNYLQNGHFCKKIAALNQACLFRDIKLYRSPFEENTDYVIKLLIRHRESKDWIIQSLIPLRFELNNTQLQE